MELIFFPVPYCNFLWKIADLKISELKLLASPEFFFVIHFFGLISCQYHKRQLINWVQAAKANITLIPPTPIICNTFNVTFVKKINQYISKFLI